ncbi:MAG: hypothetical protein JWM05_1533, partial [Acidimicrobiales bacterium]|nr:hypothetical protein [Acidimicrobiales bacterium]
MFHADPMATGPDAPDAPDGAGHDPQTVQDALADQDVAGQPGHGAAAE